jgi:diguanylate cyclase (GGDEF)-like protein
LFVFWEPKLKDVTQVGFYALRQKAAEYFQSYQDQMAAQVDRMMAYLLTAEWIGALILAVVLSPQTWNGGESRVHPHVLTVLLLGPLVVGGPVMMAFMYPSSAVTRHFIAVAQILMSALLIDITNGRIETHFHVFGSLAFLAFYRDWRVLVTASAVTAVDHLVRGVWWPQSVYGVLTVSPWRWVEHAWWVSFEDVFLILSIRRSLGEMKTVALREAELSYGAFHDVLTGLANRRLLDERFNHYASSAQDRIRQGAILFVDLDRFKHVNDTLGHAVGDRLLVQVAERLTGVLRAHDTVARVGGDEFVILIERLTSDKAAQQVGDAVLSAFNLPFDVDGHQLLLSASVGISFFPRDSSELSALQRAADLAMYEAKTSGRNRCLLFSPEMNIREQTRTELSRDLYHAISRGELDVHFQPQIGLDGNVTAFEALLRWNHSTRGLVTPSEFIPLAENSGLILAIGEWVLQRACEECRKWGQSGYTEMKVCVNVSAIQFEQPGFSDIVEGVLRDTGLKPSLLTLELTETVLMTDLALAREHLTRLRALGIGIALDDFGTGYSSLSYLQALPADILNWTDPL